MPLHLFMHLGTVYKCVLICMIIKMLCLNNEIIYLLKQTASDSLSLLYRFFHLMINDMNNMIGYFDIRLFRK